MPKHCLEAEGRHDRDSSTAYTSTREYETWTSQIINSACAQAGLPYYHWLGGYINGAVLFCGTASLHERKAQPCKSCQMRGLVCVQLFQLDLLAVELPDYSCCGWCISLDISDVDEGYKRGISRELSPGVDDGRKPPSVAAPRAAQPSYEYFIGSRQISVSAFREFVQNSFQKDADLNWVGLQRSDPLSDCRDGLLNPKEGDGFLIVTGKSLSEVRSLYNK